MNALENWGPQTDPQFANRKIIAFDLDDTLTKEGRLWSSTVRGLEKLQGAGWKTILVTGRSFAWANALAKLMPFDGIIAENGALILYWQNGQLKRNRQEAAKTLYWGPSGAYSSQRSDHQSYFENIEGKKLEILERLQVEFPSMKVASDQMGRLYDLAVDFAEEIHPPLGFEEAEKVQLLFESKGATAKISSIHVNGWWGDFSKASALRNLVESIWGRNLDAEAIYVGDSPNDGPLFEFMDCSIGVANVKEFSGMKGFFEPRYLCQQRSADGVEEIFKKLGV